MKRRSTLIAPVVFLLISCERTPTPRDNESDPSSTAVAGTESASGRNGFLIDSAHGAPSALVPLPSHQAATAPDIVGLRCTPAVFSQKDTITLRMEHPHGEYLMVTQPDSTVFFLSYPDSTEPPNFFLVAADSFAKMPTIRFKADVKSRPRVYGRDTLESVFANPGKYLLTIGHKLESEHASAIHKCTIRLVPAKR